MNIVDLGTKTNQTAIKGVVDTIAQKINSLNVGAVKSVQRGNFIMTTSGVSDVNISNINTSKSIVLLSSKGDHTGAGTFAIMAEITSSTSVRFTRLANGVQAQVHWQVIEFY